MRYGNELKVGASILLAGLIFFFGLRYFQDLPLFRGTYELETEFDNASGLIAGNQVRVRGYNVGSVRAVYINPETNRIRVRFQVDTDVVIPNDSYAEVTGLEALGVVRVTLTLGTPGAPRLEDGGFIPSKQDPDLLEKLTDRAPLLMEQVDSVLTNLDVTLSATRTLLDDPTSDLRTTLTAARGTMQTLDVLLRQEKARIRQVLTGVHELTGSLDTLATQTGGSVAVTLQNVNDVVDRLNVHMATLAGTLATLDAVMAKVDQGEGTLGLLINDPALYNKLDSTLTNVNSLVEDFKTHPRKYLRELRLIDLF